MQNLNKCKNHPNGNRDGFFFEKMILMAAQQLKSTTNIIIRIL
jgi:hypothetical protein